MSDDYGWRSFAPVPELAGFESAAGHSTVGYRKKDRGKHCKGAGNTCKGFKMAGLDYCVGHARSLGLLKKEAHEHATAVA
jgi:hypothetical protein